MICVRLFIISKRFLKIILWLYKAAGIIDVVGGASHTLTHTHSRQRSEGSLSFNSHVAPSTSGNYIQIPTFITSSTFKISFPRHATF